MAEINMKNRENEWDELERLLGKEGFDDFLDKFEDNFEKEFGNALYKQTAPVQKRVPAAKS